MSQANNTNNNKNKKIKKQQNNHSHNNKSAASNAEAPKQGDARFAKAKYDPTFMAPGAKLTKVKIDKRFGKMLKDPSFNATSSIDRYGRKKKQQDINNDLKEYYYMDEEVQDEDNMANIEEGGSEELGENGGIRSWMENYDQQSSELQDVQIQDIEDEVEEIWEDNSDHVIKNENVQATKRLALCNYDWMNITSKDLMILFTSFKPKSGSIKSVKVYMSNLGKEKLEAEQKYGPTGIWKEGVPEQQSNKAEWRKSWDELLRERRQSQNDGFDQNKLRVYEKERLKYFYAVLECDSKQTADQLYRQCDGNQFENSTIQFDLRFIPDDTVFDTANLKEQCNQLPSTGQVKNFVNKAMGHSKVGLTWEDPELNVAASLKKKNWNKLSDADLDKIDWGNYIDENQIEEEDQRVKLTHEAMKDQDVIADWRKSCNKKYKKNEDDIQITFEGGFDTKKTNKKQKQVPSLNKQKKTMKDRKRENIQEKNRQRAQIDLLVDGKPQVQFNPNLHDSRFTAVYNNPQYAIDPVDPHFDHRRSGKVFAEVVKKNRAKNIQ